MGFIKKYNQYRESALLEELGFSRKELYGPWEGVDYQLIKINKHGRVSFTMSEDTMVFPQSERGGVITLSTDVNAVYNGKTFKDKIKNWFSSSIQTLKNRTSKNKKVSNYLKGLETMRNKGFSIGKFMQGSYIDHDGKQWDEKSFNVTINGIDNNTLNAIATGLADLFNQQAVLVHRYTDGETYLLDANTDRKQAIRNDKIDNIVED